MKSRINLTLNDNQQKEWGAKGSTYSSVRRLLVLVSLLVGLGLSLIGSLLLVGELLPLLTEDLADITCGRLS